MQRQVWFKYRFNDAHYVSHVANFCVYHESLFRSARFIFLFCVFLSMFVSYCKNAVMFWNYFYFVLCTDCTGCSFISPMEAVSKHSPIVDLMLPALSNSKEVLLALRENSCLTYIFFHHSYFSTSSLPLKKPIIDFSNVSFFPPEAIEVQRTSYKRS